MSKIVRTCLMGLLVLPLAAQESNVSVSGAFIEGLQSLNKVTHQSFGWAMGADFNGILEASELPCRLGVTYALLPGHYKYDLKTSFTLAQVHGDFFLETPVKELRFVGGLSLNQYTMHKKGHEDANSLDIDHHFPVRSASGVKFGYRVGLDYAFSKKLEGEVLFQQTEMAGKDFNGDSLARAGGVNPGWLQFGITYHF